MGESLINREKTVARKAVTNLTNLNGKEDLRLLERSGG